MKKEQNLVTLISFVCFLAAAGFVVVGVAFAVLGRAMGWTGEGLQDRVVYGVRSAGAQFTTEMYGTYAKALPLGAEFVLAPTAYGVVATTYEQSPWWMRVPCGAQRSEGVPSSPYAVEYEGKIYSLYDAYEGYEARADVIDPATGVEETIPLTQVPESVRALETGQIYGTDPLPEGIRRLSDLAAELPQDNVILVQMNDYACSTTFIGGLVAAGFFATIAGLSWVYDHRRRSH